MPLFPAGWLGCGPDEINRRLQLSLAARHDLCQFTHAGDAAWAVRVDEHEELTLASRRARFGGDLCWRCRELASAIGILNQETHTHHHDDRPNSRDRPRKEASNRAGFGDACNRHLLRRVDVRWYAHAVRFTFHVHVRGSARRGFVVVAVGATGPNGSGGGPSNSTSSCSILSSDIGFEYRKP